MRARRRDGGRSSSPSRSTTGSRRSCTTSSSCPATDSQRPSSARLGVSRTPVREALFRLATRASSTWNPSPAGTCCRSTSAARAALRPARGAGAGERGAPVRRRDAKPELDELKAVWLVPAASERPSRASRRPRRAVPCDVGPRRRQRRDRPRALGRDRAHPDRPPSRLHARRPDRGDLCGACEDPARSDPAQGRPGPTAAETHIEQSKAEVRKITLAALQARAASRRRARRRLTAAAQRQRKRSAERRQPVGTAWDPATKPKHLRTFQSVASVQKRGDVVAQQSSISTQP